MKHLWLSLAVLHLQAAMAGENIIRLEVENVYAHGLAVGASGVLGQSVIITNFPNTRVSLKADFSSGDAFYTAVAERLGVTASTFQSIHLIRPSCAAELGTDSTSPPLSEKPVTFNFNRVPVEVLLEVLATQNELPVEPKQAAGKRQELGLLLDKLSWRSVYQVVSHATGATLVKDGSTYRVHGGEAHSCVNPTVAEPSAPSPTKCPMMEHPLVKKLGKPVVCEPLEAYKLPELVVRGFMIFNGTRFVLLEATDRNTFFVKRGDYLGHHFGKIATVDEEGFVVREIMEDPDGMYYKANTRISYDNKRFSLPREYP